MTIKIRRLLTPMQKNEILECDAYMCVYCGGEANCVDHIIPWDWNHNDDPINLVAACMECNLIASDNVFGSLFEKAKYIRKVRRLPRWRKRMANRNNVNICISCKSYFRMCVKGATNFLCPRCAIEAGMNPEDRTNYLRGEYRLLSIEY